MLKTLLWGTGFLSVALTLSPLLAPLALAQPASSARVIDVPVTPVFTRQYPQSEVPAQVGTVIDRSGYIRTAGAGKAQVQLQDGMILRLGGSAVLKVGSDELGLLTGALIAWYNPGEKKGVARQIRTSVAIAAIKGTTVFIESKPEGCRFFSWEGDVEVSMLDGSQKIILKGGEEVTIPMNAKTMPSVQKMSRAEIENRLQTGHLINGFNAPMDTMSIIRRELLP